jgi:competence protein ComEA
VQRVRESVWAPVALKATSIGVGMLGLAAIGAWSTLAGAGTEVNAASVGAKQAAAVVASATASPNGAVRAAPSSGSDHAEAPAAPGASAGTTPDGKVILNTASLDDLTKLPRVGRKRAEAILDLRKRLGKFRQPTDLLRVRGIGRKTLRQLLPLLVVDAPPPPR